MLAVTAALVVASLALNLYLLGQMGRQLHQAARLARALEVAADLEGGLRQALASSVAPPTLRALADELADLAGAEGAAAVREGVAAGRGASILSRLAVQRELRTGTLAALRVRGLGPMRFSLIHRRDPFLSPAARRFIRFLTPADLC